MRTCAILLAVLLSACGDDDTTADADAMANGDGDAAIDRSTDSDANEMDRVVVSGSCAPRLRMPVRVVGGTGAPAAGQVMVYWYQFDDDGPDPMAEIGYSAPFAADDDEVVIDMADVTPPGEQLLLCQRECEDESMCPCMGTTPRVGFGAVMLISGEDRTGMGFVVLGYSAEELVPIPETPENLLWRGKFPDGIGGGVCPYRVIEPETGFDNAALVTGDEATADFNVCPSTDPDCDLPSPNLT